MPRHARLLPIVLLFVCACATSGTMVPAPVTPEASSAFAEARRLVREGAEPDDPALRAALRRANELEPDWIPPLRLADDLVLQQLLGPSLLEERREGLLDAPADPVQQYLTGRLEGGLGSPRFEFAASLDPASAWAHHGRAWTDAQSGGFTAAARHEREALRLARDAWEGAFFRVALARYLRLDNRHRAALEVMLDPAARDGLSRDDRAWFELETALVQLGQSDFDEMRAGYRRGIELIRRVDLPAQDLERLSLELLGSLAGKDVSARQLQLALAARPGEDREYLRARLLVSRGGGNLARVVARDWHGDGKLEVSRMSLFYAGRFAEAMDSWLASCPPQVLDEHGQPRGEHLRRACAAARELGYGVIIRKERRHHLLTLGEALIAAGWFDETLAVADELAELDLEAALALNDRTLAGALCVDRLAERIAEGEEGLPGFDDPLADPEDRVIELEDMDDVRITRRYDRIDRWLIALAPVFARAHEQLGGETDPELVRQALLDSPRLDYGPVGSLLHPGVRYSAADASAGLGQEGAVVTGFAEELDRLGRFGIVGTLIGRGLDGMLLRRIAIEERSGEHLGVPWRGTVAWCEGLDTGGANGGAGVKISGAALHEGYWVDLETVRGEHRRWNELAGIFEQPGGAERVRRALETRGLPLSVAHTNPEARARQRRMLQPSLGQSQRMRLAVLAERRAAGQDGIRLGELVECVAVHEEGHLCDRTRFLPLHRNLGSALFLLLDNGFSPAAVQEHLEYRAQLTALCAVTEPRIAFADVVQSSEVADDGPLPHARAYRVLLADLLEVLDLELQRDPASWPRLEAGRTLMHQLHRLSGDEVRRLALMLARREGLVGG
jgi:hypothetical protein